MTRSLKTRILVVAAFAVMILVNYLSNALPINGVSMTEISARYAVLFTPAGFTFAIWGVIYLALLGFVIYQLLPQRNHDVLVAKITPLFILNCGVNAAWIVVWHYGLLLVSLGLMLVILATLVLIWRKIYAARGSATLGRWIFVTVPFSLYTGWITAATIANASIVQYDMGLNDLWLSAADWTLLKLAGVGVIGALMALRRRDIPFVLVIAWAAFGISSKQVGTPIISGAAQLVCVMMLLLAVVGLFCRPRKPAPAHVKTAKVKEPKVKKVKAKKVKAQKVKVKRERKRKIKGDAAKASEPADMATLDDKGDAADAS